MSNELYPELPGLAYGVKRTPVWSTDVRTTPTGVEYRSSEVVYPRYRLQLVYEFLRSLATWSELQTLEGFFNRHHGRLSSFLLHDPDDDAVVAQSFGIGDGSTVQHTLVRTRGGFVQPVSWVNGAATVYANGIPANNLLAPNGGFEVDSNGDNLSDNVTLHTAGSFGTITLTRPTNGSGKCQKVQSNALGTTFADRIGVKMARVNVADLFAQPLTLSATVQGNGVGAILYMTINWIDGVGSFISDSPNYGTALPTGSMSLRSVTGLVPAGAFYADCYILATTATSVGTVGLRVDDVKLEIGSTPTAFVDLLGTVVNSPTAPAVVNWTSPPPAATALTWSGNYYWRTRFDTDELDFEKFMADLWKSQRVDLMTTTR